MKTKILFILWLLPFAIACKHKEKQVDYDRATISEYNNMYDDNGRLERVKIIDKDYFVENNIPIEANYYVIEQRYSYKNDIEYTMEEVSSIGNIRKIINFSEKSEETIRIENNADTIYYHLRQSYKGIIPSYEKNKIRFKCFLTDFEINDDYERYYFFDDDDQLIKVINIDHITGKTTEEWEFGDISFEEAMKRVRPSSNQIKIICRSSQTVGDTLLTKRFENGVLTNTYKTYRNGESEWDLTFTADNELSLSIETIERNNEKIVITIDPEFESIDSLFYQNNKEVKSVFIFPDSKTTTLMEYDSKGNISKEMRYTKDNN